MAIVIGDVAELPDDATAERAEFERQGIRSLINVPMVAAGKTVGFIGFDSLSTAQTWADVDVRLLRLVGEMFLNALERKQADERMASLMASKDQLVASVSHELRTPLTVVVGLVEELATRPDLPPGDRTEFVELIRDQSHELTHIVEDLLVASRAGTGELVVVPERLSLAHEIGQVLKLMPDPRGKSIETRGHCRDVDADRLRVRQILRNLLSNAIRYGGGLITITLEDRPGRSALMVADDGPGIPLEDRDRIFELYQRAHETPGLPGSLGIGLAVSRRLARLMGGDLTFGGGDGNAFVLELPPAVEDRAPDPAPDGAGRSADPPADVAAHTEGPRSPAKRPRG